ILAFEFATSYEELKETLDPLSPDQLDGLDMVNYIDFGYMIAYSLFLFCVFWVTRNMSGQRYLLIGMVLSGVALFADAFENFQLLNITSLYRADTDAESYNSVLSNLFIFTWLKWGALAIAMEMLIPVLVRRGIFSKIIAGVLALAPLMLIGVIISPTRFMMDKFGLAVIFGFIALSIYVIAYRKPIAQ
ncbi:MAG: hypothetical protein KJP00_07800, partial [Bacteroidia bacterium]|nr:hypothetical protein [Bacteroidia bacterium]